MKFYEEYASINGIRQYFLHYPAAASDSVLLYLHGGPGFSAAYQAYLFDTPDLPCSFVFYDQRGAGKTLMKNKLERPDFSMLLEDLRCTVLYLKEKYHTNKIILLGHSWGSVLGSEYAVQYADTISAYIGMGPVVHMLHGEKAAFGELKRRIFSKKIPKDVRKYNKIAQRLSFENRKSFAKSRRGLGFLQLRYGFFPNWRLAVKNVWKSPVFSIKDTPAFLLSPNMNKKLNQTLWAYDAVQTPVYSLPVYYILGRDDWQVPSTVAAQYFKRIRAPKKHLFWIPAAGHSTGTDNPIAFWNAVSEILLQLNS